MGTGAAARRCSAGAIPPLVPRAAGAMRTSSTEGGCLEVAPLARLRASACTSARLHHGSLSICAVACLGQPVRHLRVADGVGGVEGVVQVQRHVPQLLRGLRGVGQEQVQGLGFMTPAWSFIGVAPRPAALARPARRRAGTSPGSRVYDTSMEFHRCSACPAASPRPARRGAGILSGRRVHRPGAEAYRFSAMSCSPCEACAAGGRDGFGSDCILAGIMVSALEQHMQSHAQPRRTGLLSTFNLCQAHATYEEPELRIGGTD